jgi:VCBS repeat-containing protein
VDGNLDTNSVSQVSGPSNGSLTLNSDGTFSYDPNLNFNGSDSFVYQVCDTVLACDTATVTLTVNPINDPPVAQDDSFSGNVNTTISGDVLADNGNGPDSDVDGNLDANSVSQMSGPGNGSLTLNSDGSFSYDPNPNFTGSDSFVYQVCDTALDCDTATVTLTVNPLNNPPVAMDDGYVIDEDTLLSVAAPGVLGNDTDLDGDSLTAVLVNDVSDGSLTLHTDGSFSYTPNTDFNGTDSFTYLANDGLADSNTTTVTLTVNPINDPPVAQDDSFSGNENTTISGEVLVDNGNGPDSDVDGNLDTNSVSLVSGSSNGNLALSNDGTFSYDPNPNFTGSDSFVYQVCDTALACDTATVIITVLQRQRQVYLPIVLSGSGL